MGPLTGQDQSTAHDTPAHPNPSRNLLCTCLPRVQGQSAGGLRQKTTSLPNTLLLRKLCPPITVTLHLSFNREKMSSLNPLDCKQQVSTPLKPRLANAQDDRIRRVGQAQGLQFCFNERKCRLICVHCGANIHERLVFIPVSGFYLDGEVGWGREEMTIY